MTKNMIFRQNVNKKLALLLFILLYKNIYYQKIDNKNITNTIKLVKKLV